MSRIDSIDLDRGARRLAGRVGIAALVILGAPPGHAAELADVDGWIQIETDHFSVYSSASQSKTRKMVTDLERFREVLGLITKGFDLSASVPTSVFVFKNDHQMRPYKVDDQGQPWNVAGYYLRGRFRNYVAIDASAGSSRSRVIYHEFVHSVMHETFGRMPQWLDEGLAEYYSTFRFNNLSNTAWVGDPIESHLYQLSQYPMMPLDQLFSITTRSPEYNEGTMQGTFYAQSWMLVHYLVATDSRRAAFGSYLTRLREGADEREALEAALGQDLAALTTDLSRYMTAGGSGNYRITLPDDVDVSDLAVAPLPPEDLLLHLAALLAHRGPHNADAARTHVEAATRRGAHPGAADAILGLIAEDAGDTDEAERRYRGSLEQQPADPVVLTRLANLILRRDAGPDPVDASGLPDHVATARRLYRRALEVDRTNFEATAGMGHTYFWETRNFDPGLQLLASAATVRPDRLDVVANLAMLMARSGRIAGARQVVEQKLRRCGADPQLIADVESWIAGEEARLARDGGSRTALQMLEEAAREESDPAMKSEIERLRGQIESGDLRLVEGDRERLDETARLTEIYNASVNHMNAGEAEMALALLEPELESCGVPEICQRIQESHDSISAWVARSRMIARYNAAIDALKQGDRPEAIRLLRELVVSDGDEEIRASSQNLLDQLIDD